ncbi:hypothetical protein ONE63_010278 [Megalurothrips usitatus]|uniref:Vesicular, overexpressed in cancer, prosurvival protein 1 n=1 Tax=Megalurothrips usitatus TaxID=439358 RepID=A0AAV7XL15_9NEOP|nr:hypothetical protein ONE63_010278 [Megalurothrips usitatus]
MARSIEECNAILRNLSQELRSRCPAGDQYCCYLHCCFVVRQPKELWETWYFWFGMAVVALLLVTSAGSFAVGMCARKRHQLIRVHHQPGAGAGLGPGLGAAEAEGGHCGGMTVNLARATATAPVTAVTGPDGLIQPYVAGTGDGALGLPAEVAARYKTQGTPTATAIFRGRADSAEGGSGSLDQDGDVDEGDEGDDGEDVAGPLEPAYPPMQPVTIVRGPLPEGGYRHTETFTELVLPPGYVDPQPSHKHP